MRSKVRCWPLMAAWVGAAPLSALADTTVVDSVNQICESSATECRLSDSDIEIVPDITLDFGDRPFIVSSSARINIPTGSVVIQAQGFTLETGGTLEARGCGEDACGNLTIETDSYIYLYDDVTLQGDIEGGDLTLDSDGPIVITGKLTSNGGGGFSKGGNIRIDSADNLQVDEIDIDGSNNADHYGGSLVLISHNGITLNDRINAVGWAGGGVSVFSNGVINMIGGGIDAYARGLGQTSGDIDLRSQVQVSIGFESKLDVSGQNGRRNDGGTVYIRSAGSVFMSGSIHANATSATGGSDEDSNAGSVRIDAGTTLSLSGEIDLNSAAKATWGGMVMLNAGQTLNQINRIDVSAGLQGGEVHMLSAKDILIAENIDADSLAPSRRRPILPMGRAGRWISKHATC
jgi:hypothetical protein